jgi:hypothetical protein
MFKWHGVTCPSLVLLVMICSFMYYFIFIIPDKVRCLHNALDTCIGPVCDKPICKMITNGRDSGYNLSGNGNKNCLFSVWELSHMFFHIFIGYYYNIYVSTAISVGFEMHERISYNCASYNDIFINFTGFLIGHALKKLNV